MKQSEDFVDPTVGMLDEATSQWEHEVPQIDSALFQAVSLITILGSHIENEFRTFSQSELDMSTGDLRILLSLRRNSPTFARSPVQLQKSLLVTSGAITKQIARLQARKLIERMPQEGGRRGYLVRLTKSGMNLLDSTLVRQQHVAYPLFADAFHALPEAEQQQGVRFLRRLMGKLEAVGTRGKAAPERVDD